MPPRSTSSNATRGTRKTYAVGCEVTSFDYTRIADGPKVHRVQVSPLKHSTTTPKRGKHVQHTFARHKASLARSEVAQGHPQTISDQHLNCSPKKRQRRQRVHAVVVRMPVTVHDIVEGSFGPQLGGKVGPFSTYSSALKLAVIASS